MATIADKLNKLVDLKTNLATNLNTKGVDTASSTMTYNELIPKVLDIKTGTSSITDATAEPSDILKGKIAYNNTGKIIGTIESSIGVKITPTSNNQTIAAGYYSTDGTIYGDNNLIASNIKSGVSIFGVSGTYKPEKIKLTDISAAEEATAADIVSGKKAYNDQGELITGTHTEEAGIDTSDATATANDILLNKTAYIDGKKVVGTIPSLMATSYTPTTTDITITSNQYLSGDQTIIGDKNLIPENIKKDITIFGVKGTAESGSSSTGETIIFDSREMSSTDAIVQAYKGKVYQKMASDTNWNELASTTDYGKVGVFSSTGVYGLNHRITEASYLPAGYYFTEPLKITTDSQLLELQYYASTWINPKIYVYLISANSIDEIPTKIANEDFAYSTTVTWATVENNTVKLYKQNIPIGNYYVYSVIKSDSEVSANEALLTMLGIICI